jgi:hypothetical protein
VSGAASSQEKDRLRLCSERSSALNQVNDKDNDGNHEQQMDQSAADVAEKTQKPQNEENHKYGPKHGFISFDWFRLFMCNRAAERTTAKSE